MSEEISIRFKLNSDSKDVVVSEIRVRKLGDALEGAAKKANPLNTNMQGLGSATKKTTDRMQDLIKRAEELYAKDPTQKYRQGMLELDVLFKRGLINTKLYTSEQQRLKNELAGTEGGFKILGMRMDKAVKIGGTLFLIYKGIRAAIDSVIAPGIKFNAEIETMQTGIASLISVNSKNETSTGRMIGQAEKFSMATIAAKGAIKSLREANLETAATLVQLSEGFNATLGPALEAGFNIKETVNYTKLMTQAAGAMHVPMYQLAQEMRSVVSGTIDANSIVAKNIGITNEQIKSAKESGRLYEFLTDKLAGFAIAGEEVANSWDGSVSNMEDAWDGFAGAVAKPVMEPLKKGIQSAAQWFVDATEKVNDFYAAMTPASEVQEIDTYWKKMEQLGEQWLKTQQKAKDSWFFKDAFLKEAKDIEGEISLLKERYKILESRTPQDSLVSDNDTSTAVLTLDKHTKNIVKQFDEAMKIIDKAPQSIDEINERYVKMHDVVAGLFDEAQMQKFYAQWQKEIDKTLDAQQKVFDDMAKAAVDTFNQEKKAFDALIDSQTDELKEIIAIDPSQVFDSNFGNRVQAAIDNIQGSLYLSPEQKDKLVKSLGDTIRSTAKRLNEEGTDFFQPLKNSISSAIVDGITSRDVQGTLSALVGSTSASLLQTSMSSILSSGLTSGNLYAAGAGIGLSVISSSLFSESKSYAEQQQEKATKLLEKFSEALGDATKYLNEFGNTGTEIATTLQTLDEQIMEGILASIGVVPIGSDGINRFTALTIQSSYDWESGSYAGYQEILDKERVTAQEVSAMSGIEFWTTFKEYFSQKQAAWKVATELSEQYADTLMGALGNSLDLSSKSFQDAQNILNGAVDGVFDISYFEKLSSELDDLALAQKLTGETDSTRVLEILQDETYKAGENFKSLVDIITSTSETSSSNMKSWRESFMNAEEIAQSMASGFGVSLAKTADELDDLFLKLSADADGLTDAELSFLEANRDLISGLDDTRTEIEKIVDLTNQYASIDLQIAKLRGDENETQLSQAIETMMNWANDIGASYTYDSAYASLMTSSVASLESWNQHLKDTGLELSSEAMSAFSTVISARLDESDAVAALSDTASALDTVARTMESVKITIKNTIDSIYSNDTEYVKSNYFTLLKTARAAQAALQANKSDEDLATAFQTAVSNFAGATSSYLDPSNFASKFDYEFAKASTANSLSNFGSTADDVNDYLSQITENTAATANALVQATTNTSANPVSYTQKTYSSGVGGSNPSGATTTSMSDLIWVMKTNLDMVQVTRREYETGKALGYYFADGGIVTAPTIGMIGEAGKSEAVIPLNDPNDPLGQNEVAALLRSVLAELRTTRTENAQLRHEISQIRLYIMEQNEILDEIKEAS